MAAGTNHLVSVTLDLHNMTLGDRARVGKSNLFETLSELSGRGVAQLFTTDPGMIDAFGRAGVHAYAFMDMGLGTYALMYPRILPGMGSPVDGRLLARLPAPSSTAVSTADDASESVGKELAESGSKGGVETSQKLLNVGTKSDAISGVNNLPEAIQSKVKDFYRGGSNAYNNFGVEQLGNGNYLVQMTKPGNVPGSYATYFKEITEVGETVVTYKNTIDPLGNLVHTKIK